MRIQHLSSKVLLVLFIFIGIVACEQNSDETPQFIEPITYQTSLDEMPELGQFLSSYIGSSRGNADNIPEVGGGDNYSDLIERIDFDYILARMDTSGQTYMSMSIANEDPKVIQNLVIGKDINQNLLTPMIFTYTMDDEFYEIYLKTGSLEGFSGNFHRASLTPFAYTQNENAANIAQYRSSTSEPCPDETSMEPNRPTSRTNRGTNTSQTGTTGSLGTSSCTYEMKYIGEICVDTFNGKGDIVGSDCQDQWVMVVTCPEDDNEYSSSDDPCDDPNSGEVPVVPQVILDSSFTSNELLMCIWNKLKGIKGMQIQLRNFDSDMSIYNLKIEVKPFDYYDGYSRNGATRSYEGSNEINVLLNENKLNRPVLDIARTIYHEAIHAEMFRKVREHGNIENVKEENYPGIYDYYRRKIKGWQHELMAEHYVKNIANLLEQFDGGFEEESVYTALAWVGLKGYVDNEGNFNEYTAWSNLSSAKQEEYINLKNEFMKRGSLLCD